MTYDPKQSEESTKVESAIKTLESVLGIKLYIVKGGPSIEDPLAEVGYFLGVRDVVGTGTFIKIKDGEIRLVGVRRKSDKLIDLYL